MSSRVAALARGAERQFPVVLPAFLFALISVGTIDWFTLSLAAGSTGVAFLTLSGTPRPTLRDRIAQAELSGSGAVDAVLAGDAL
jgi:hypothetical protein